MIEDYGTKKTQTKGKLVFSEFKKVVILLINPISYNNCKFN